MKSEWVKPGTGRTVGELRCWVGTPTASGRDDWSDRRPTALDIVRSGPPEPYDVERVKEAIRRVEVEGEAPTQTLGMHVEDDEHGSYSAANAIALLREVSNKRKNARAAIERVDAAKLRLVEARADTETAIRLLGFMFGKGDRFEAAREVLCGAKAAETEAWRQWQACW